MRRIEAARRGKSALVAAASFAAMAAAGACGREDIELANAPADGAAAEGAVEGAVNGGEASTFGEGGLNVCSLESGVRPCHGLGEACSLPDECCSGRCESGTCVPAGTCGIAGAACTARADCCSGLCEPTPGGAARACLDYCKPAGAACARPQDCCSVGCNGGVCGATICTREGDDCTTDSQCCSAKCGTDSKCALDTAAGCRATGEDCNSGGGPSCCASCVNGRCDLGAGPCRAVGSLCSADGDCCNGSCVATTGGFKTCGSACAAQGATCTTTSDCCVGTTCTGLPATCQPPTNSCKLRGDTCMADTECCSLQCLEGRCGDNCPVVK